MAKETMRVAVDSPSAVPLPYGLLSTATEIIDATDPHEMAGVNWLSSLCGEAGITDWCPPDSESPGEVSPSSPGPGEKHFNKPEAETAPDVIVYYGEECSATGYDYSVSRRNVEIGLEIGKNKALEQWFLHEILSPRAINVCESEESPGESPADMSARKLPVALAAVESALAERFGGQGVIHVPVGAASLFGSNRLIIEDNQGYHTWLGHRVALGVGYQDNIGPHDSEGNPIPAPAGQTWIYATGPIVIRTDETIISPPDSSQSFSMKTNDRRVIAEKPYVVQTTCAIVACLADISCSC